MNRSEPPGSQAPNAPPAPKLVRLPGFLIEEEIGLGDLVKRVTSAFGIMSCGGCEKRAAALNQWLHISR